MKYYNLNVHSCYDLLNSTIKLENLFQKLKKNNSEKVVIADPNMYAAIKSYKLSKKYNIKIIHALEVKASYGLGFLSINVICKNSKMFYKLCELTTIFKTREEELNIEDFCKYLLGYEDDFYLIVNDKIESLKIFYDVANYFKNFKHYFAYNENYDYKIYSNIKNIIYSKPSFYLDYNNYQTLTVVRAIKDNIKININDIAKTCGEEYVYTQEDFLNLYSNIINPLEKEVIQKAVEEQSVLIKYIDYELELSSYHLPKYKYSEEEKIFENKKTIDYLKYLVLKGVKKKLVGKDLLKYKKRYEYEISVIESMNFTDYFLIVYDFVKYAKKNGIYVGAGRGSAAGSLVCYLLDITEADPLEYNLLFERFLNKERITMPDIDIDFQDTRRDEVIRYVEEKYGKEKVSQIMTFTTFQSKSAARESARILQFSETELKKISTLIDSNKTLTECYKEFSQLRDFINESEYKKRWFSVALNLENLPKNTSVHAAGVVISDEKNLLNYVPLEKSNVTNYLTQWTMDDVESVGLLKIDFLGIRYLTMLESISSEIKKINQNFDINKINFTDANVYKLFSQGKTEGIFQFESSGMKEKLRLLKPNQFNDIVAMNALYRPGPMAQIETYIKRKNKEEEVIYPHNKLEKILKDTYGVIVYQEQIMLIAVNFANMTLNEADNMRRAVSKKKKEDLEKYGKLFIEKTVASGYSLDVAKNLFNFIVTFANYGFNKSHAVVYSMLAYKLAYLKVYYTKYFMTSLLNNVISSEKKINEYKQELNNVGIKLLKPSVNESNIHFSVLKDNIIFALVAIKNVGYRAASEIVIDRQNYGRYENIYDFLNRMNKKVDYQAATSLVKAGALDTLGHNRATLMNQIKDYYEDKREHINNVRLAVANISGLTLKVDEVEDYSIQEKIKMEKEVTGTYFLKHPVQLAKEKYYYLPLKYLGDNEGDSYVEIITVKEIKTKKGEYMAFLTVNDGKGEYDVTIFPNIYKFARTFLKNNNFLVITVKPQLRNARMQYILEKISTIDNYLEFCLKNIKQIYVLVDKENNDFIESAIKVGGKTKLICISEEDKNKNKITNIENAQNFVRYYISNYPKKAIKLEY